MVLRQERHPSIREASASSYTTDHDLTINVKRPKVSKYNAYSGLQWYMFGGNVRPCLSTVVGRAGGARELGAVVAVGVPSVV